ncbi:MAG: class I SAM-dependent methyltransferase [Clostridia bacterium]|nr:class I SAM-dependent methyltransferase [Clostridia bacterium]
MELSPKLYKWFVRPEWFSKVFVRNIIEDRFDFENKAVLDFGCGIGSSSFMFEPNNYIGIDCDSKRIRYAKRQHPEYTFEVSNGYGIPLPEGTIDYILIISVLHHIPKDKLPMYLREFRRVIKPYGRIVVIEPCYYDKPCISNSFMKFADRGKYIQGEAGYIQEFKNCQYDVEIHDRHKQLFFYNKIFFSATPNR